jgi:hypothetical protein
MQGAKREKAEGQDGVREEQAEKQRQPEAGTMKRIRGVLSKATGITAGCLAVGALVAPVAQADFGIEEFSVTNSRDGSFSRQAGEHADLITGFTFNHAPDGAPGGNPKDISVDLPPGFLGNPNSAATCEPSKLIYNNRADSACPIASQVGIADIEVGTGHVPIYNMAHDSSVPARFAFSVAIGVPVYIEPRVRPGDYGISAGSTRTSQAEVVNKGTITLWGVPADHSHDVNRWDPDPYGCGIGCLAGFGAASPGPRLPFLSNPTSCPGIPGVFRIEANSWQNQDLISSKTVDADPDGTPFVTEGCEKLEFNPSVKATPTSSKAAGPTGLNFNLKVPKNEDPDGLSTAHVRKTVVTFPKGVSVNASSAAGLASCSPAQIGLGSNDPPSCPDSSKIGTVKIKTPLLEDELVGDVILAKQDDNPFNSLLAVYIAVKGPGFYLKLPGRVDADPGTGQLTTTFTDTPQLPFEELSLTLNSGPRAPLQAPDACGTYKTKVEITSWSSPLPVTLDTPMTIDEGCATGGFAPSLKAGTLNPAAGKFSPFSLRITRADGEENLSRIEATLPPGLLAKLAGVPLCPEAGAASGACPAASQVGTTMVAAGAGPNPVFVPESGKAPTAVYLAGPYKSAPYSLVVKVPAQAGPFDLGTVTVRNALFVDPVTTQVTAKSDPLPRILKGIPVSYRDVRIGVDRPDFTLNPTSCTPMAVTSTITSAQGRSAHPSAPFKVSGCRELGFKPRLSISLKGGTKRGGFPALTAILRPRPGDSNLAKTVVTLPHSEFLEQGHIRTVCTRPQYAADNCPPGSVYGYAIAHSPLVDQPLAGPVYLRSSDNPLPDLAIALHGAIDIDVTGRIDAVNGGIRSTFESVPDAPVSSFKLTFIGGKKGLLVNSRDICGIPGYANAKFSAYNGKPYTSHPVLHNRACAKSARRAKRPAP